MELTVHHAQFHVLQTCITSTEATTTPQKGGSLAFDKKCHQQYHPLFFVAAVTPLTGWHFAQCYPHGLPVIPTGTLLHGARDFLRTNTTSLYLTCSLYLFW